jgi:FkbM family methyltransferase
MMAGWIGKLASRFRAGGDQFAPAEAEDELKIVPFLCSPEKISLDIGADQGGYALLLCNYSIECIAFEPSPDRAAIIRNVAAAKGLPITVETVALSNHEGTAELRMLVNDPGRSTIESLNSLNDPDGSPTISVNVPAKRLDDYGLKSVGFMKIDVEGHEIAVLEGARKTIEASKPNLLIEIEERHHPGALQAVRSFLATLGYEGFYVLDGQVHPFADFEIATYQNPANIGSWKSHWKRFGVYINNFFFLPDGNAGILREAVENLSRNSAAQILDVSESRKG